VNILKILFLTHNFPPERDAASSRVYERAYFWKKDGHDVTVITCAPNHPEGRVFPGFRNKWYQVEEMDGIRVVRVKTYIAANKKGVKRILNNLSFMVAGMVAGLFQKRPDVIMATSPQIFTAVAGFGLGLLRRRPWVMEVADLWPQSLVDMGALGPGIILKMFTWMEMFLYRRAKVVVCLTRAFKRDLIQRGIAPGKLAVIINGVDLSRYSPRPRHEDLEAELGLTGKLVVGYLGTFGLAQGLENVLETARLMGDRPEICFLMVGTGSQREGLLEKARAADLDNVVFVPPQNKEKIADYWSLCDVALVHLSDKPVFSTVIPSKIFEGMAMGLPLLLVAPRGEASAIIEEEEVGIWAEPANPEAMRDAVYRLLSDTDLYSRLKQQCAVRVGSHSRRVQAEKVIATLAGIVDKNPELPENVR